MNKYYLLAFALLGLTYYCCDGPFPQQSKLTVPADHTRNYNGVLHAGDRKDNKTGINADDCKDCHGYDLRGGMKQIDGEWRYSPSCYQCHGEIEDGENIQK